MMENIFYKSNHFSDEHLKDVAELHRSGIPAGFLSSLGIEFLACLYGSISRCASGVLIAAVDSSNKVVGFVSGTTSTRSVYMHLARQHFFMLALLLFKHFFALESVRRIFETKRYATKERSGDHETPAELLSVVVSTRLQGAGIAQELFEQLKQAFRQKGVKQFKIIVGSQLVPAQKFYAKVGAVKVAEIELHHGEWSFEYRYVLQ